MYWEHLFVSLPAFDALTSVVLCLVMVQYSLCFWGGLRVFFSLIILRANHRKNKFGTVGFGSQCLSLLCWGPRVLFLCPLLSPLFLRCWNYLPLTHGTRELSCLASRLPASKLTPRCYQLLARNFGGVNTSLFMDINQYLKNKSSDFKFLSGPPSLKNINIKRGCHRSLVSMIVNLEYL